MDLLSDILRILKLAGTLYFRTAFTAPWGVEVPSFENVSRFHYVHRGRCAVRIEGQTEALYLSQGDLIVITGGAQHTLSDPLDVESKSVDRIVELSGFTGRGALVYGDANTGHETQLICGHFSFDRSARHVLIDTLPAFIHITDYGKVAPDWLDDSLAMMQAEIAADELGASLITTRLAEVIFARAVRYYLLNGGQNQPGLAGFTDTHIRRALEAIHEQPAVGWTVDRLARIAGLSRTRFASRFSELVTVTPLSYVTNWRMQLARQLLSDTRLPIIEVATRSGYQSEASFGRVFKRYFDLPPAGYRRQREKQLPMN